jgi:hypothetical protein
MSKLGAVIESVEKHAKFVHEQVKRARTDEKFGREMTRGKRSRPEFRLRTPTGLAVAAPRSA